MKTLKSNKGVSLIAVLIIVVLIIALAVTVYFGFIKKDEPKENNGTTTSNETTNTTTNISTNTTTNTTNTTENTTEIKENKTYNIQGSFYPDLGEANDAPHYSFSGTKVLLEGNYIQTGTYTIEGNKVKIHFTKIEGPDEENGKYIDEDDELTILDDNTLQSTTLTGNIFKYVKK